MKKIMPLMALGLMLAASTQVNSDTGKYFEVTVTNLTRGQQFTPILVASHRAEVKLFKLGSPASPELATLAEEGNTARLPMHLRLCRRCSTLQIQELCSIPARRLRLKSKHRGDSIM